MNRIAIATIVALHGVSPAAALDDAKRNALEHFANVAVADLKCDNLREDKRFTNALRAGVGIDLDDGQQYAAAMGFVASAHADASEDLTDFCVQMRLMYGELGFAVKGLLIAD